MNILADNLGTVANSIIFVLSAYSFKIFAGLLVLIIGLVVASLLKDFVKLIFSYFKFDKWLESAGIAKKADISIWPNILGELVRWIIIFIFLMSAVEIWGIPKVGEVLDQLLAFLPNVVLAIIIGGAGLVTSKLSYDIVRHASHGLGKEESLVLASVAKYTIIFFTVLIILNQLGVAAELVKILFTGIVAMLSLAFGLAFGLGGQDEARNILKNLRKKLEK